MKHQTLTGERNEVTAQGCDAFDLLEILMQRDCFVLMSENMRDAGIFLIKPEQEIKCLKKCSREKIYGFIDREWLIALKSKGVSKYEISQAGRDAYLSFKQIGKAPYLSVVKAISFDDEVRVRGGFSRMQSTETPIQTLARKNDKTGKPYLNAKMVSAAERLYEDFEISGLANDEKFDWKEMLQKEGRQNFDINLGAYNKEEAKERWVAAISDLGTGLADITFYVCCAHEGLESAEKRLGWSARSGKIVLRIALMRLADFYQIPDLQKTEHMFGG